MRSHDSGETWVCAVSSAVLLPAKMMAMKCFCNSARCLQSQYLQRTLKFFADRCFMQLCVYVIMKCLFSFNIDVCSGSVHGNECII